MKALLLSAAVLAALLAAPVPFLGDGRSRRSLLILAIFSLGVAALAYVIAEERSRAVNLVTYLGMIGLFWITGKFEAK